MSENEAFNSNNTHFGSMRCLFVVVHHHVCGAKKMLNNDFLKQKRIWKKFGYIHEKESQSTTEHVCQKCGREYARAKQLKNHMRIHSKKYLEAKSTCNICEKDFRCNASLKIHVNAIHNRQRDYACDICGKCFTRSRTLTTHRKIHDYIKQFECIYCCSAYRDKRNLVNHIQRYHPRSELKFNK